MMSLTLRDIMERMARLDEITLLEVLNISSEELVERFADKIEDKFDELEIDLDD
jgi:hypothetical protein